MSQRVIMSILLLTVSLVTNVRNVPASGRRFTRKRACNLLLPPDTITYSYVVSKRAEYIAMIAPLKDACCTIYDYTMRNCTVALTDRFQHWCRTRTLRSKSALTVSNFYQFY